MYESRYISSDIKDFAANQDAHLKDCWGAFWHADMLWVANYQSGFLSTHDDDGVSQPTVINIPLHTTGMRWYSGSSGFNVSNGTDTKTAQILGVTNNGQIWAWNADIDPLNAIVVYTDPSAMYRGFDIDQTNNHLLIADFQSGMVKVFDDTFTPISSNTDPSLLAINYAPTNVYINYEYAYVTFALRNPTGPAGIGVAGNGNGFVSVFNLDGTFNRRLINQGSLNNPWGMTRVCDSLLVGQLAGGVILEFDIDTGKMLSTYSDCYGNVLFYGGLWELVYVDEYKTLYTTSGANRGQNGLISRIKRCYCKEGRRKCRCH